MKEKADIIITNKWHPLSNTTASKLRMILSRLFNLLVRLLIGLHIDDTQTGSKTIKRYVLDSIVGKCFTRRYTFDVELILLALNSIKNGYKIVEVSSLAKIKTYISV